MGDRSVSAFAEDRDWAGLRRYGGFAVCAFLGENAGADGVSGGPLESGVPLPPPPRSFGIMDLASELLVKYRFHVVYT